MNKSCSQSNYNFDNYTDLISDIVTINKSKPLKTSAYWAFIFFLYLYHELKLIQSKMNIITLARDFFETKAFGVCSWLGDLLHMRTSVIRLFFIYASFLTVGSPLIIYMILAFWIKMKSYVFTRRTSVWDL